jgi:DNA-binding response OmpR family regulator
MEESGIIVVDDDRDNLNLIELFFMCEGLKIDCAGSGERALGILAEREFSIMLTDLNMPGMNGLELARKVREQSPLISIYLYTGQPTEEVEKLAAQAGIVRVFPKPFNLQLLLDLSSAKKKREPAPETPRERPVAFLREMRPALVHT